MGFAGRSDPASVQKLARLYLERVGQLLDDCEGGVAGAALKVTDIGAVDARLERKLLLRPASGLSQTTEIDAEAPDDIHEREVTLM